jgi:hypothetical protein
MRRRVQLKKAAPTVMVYWEPITNLFCGHQPSGTHSAAHPSAGQRFPEPLAVGHVLLIKHFSPRLIGPLHTDYQSVGKYWGIYHLSEGASERRNSSSTPRGRHGELNRLPYSMHGPNLTRADPKPGEELPARTP